MGKLTSVVHLLSAKFHLIGGIRQRSWLFLLQSGPLKKLWAFWKPLTAPTTRYSVIPRQTTFALSRYELLLGLLLH
jgi:hypothetical protein